MRRKSKKTNRGERRPLEFKRWSSAIGEVKAKSKKSEIEVLIASLEPNQSREVKVVENEGRVEVVAKRKLSEEDFSPCPVKTVLLNEKALQTVELRTENLEGFRPEHLAFRALPLRLRKDVAMVPHFQNRAEGGDNFGMPGTVFPPDTRKVFSDKVFPFSTCGRIQTRFGWGSGVMVGPRHMATANHVINWGTGYTADYLKFAPPAIR